MKMWYKIILEAIVFLFCLCNIVSSNSRDLYSARIRGISFSCLTATNAAYSFLNNLNFLLSDFNHQAYLNHYYNTSIGDGPDRIYGYYMCRADVGNQVCYSCILNGTQLATEADCKHVDGILFSEMCVFRYANHSMYGLWETNLHSSYDYLEVNVSNYQQFNQTLSSTLEALIDEAAFGSSNKRTVPGFSVMEADVAGTETIYSLAQCAPDIVGLNCSRCLRSGLSDLQRYAYGAPGAIAMMDKCQIRYDNVSFYDVGDVNIGKGNGLRSPGMVPLYSVLFLFVYFRLTVLS